MKKLSIILASLLVTGYVVFSVIYFSNSSRNVVCNNFEVVLKDSTYVRFIRQSDIEDLLKRKKIYPVGKKMGEINTLQIQDTILTNRLVKSAKVYTAQNGSVIAHIYQREPVLRVIRYEGSFYIDDREPMPVSTNFTVYVPLATGAIDESLREGTL